MDKNVAEILAENYQRYIKGILQISAIIDSFAVGTFNDYVTSTIGQLGRIQELFERQRVLIRRVRYFASKVKLLSKNEKLCIFHYYVKGCKGKDIGNKFNFSERTFYRSKSLGIKKLNQHMSDIESADLDISTLHQVG